ncbi:hypothetical protein TWF694_006385 [Orbilia ellipsospora]|uniref:Calcineurin-like phosphoesterase domain-containing protein n=1 Tax=Orbilia ellipsospora TaxID=2528407 RepID=A0AAV9XMI0_9PEZI
MWQSLVVGLGLSSVALACGGCTGTGDVEMVRRARLLQPRMQPDAQPAVNGPRGPLPWGQITFAHTSDTHGWLEGHVKEANYGADWGDYVSFIRHMRYKARSLGVDFLVVDSGDLHDGAGITDATAKLPGGVNGQVGLPIYKNLDYDLLTIGNHELYVADITYDVFENFAKSYGSKYLTSNVQIRDPKDNKFKYIGKQYKYFTTYYGIRIMAFGVLFDFTGNANNSKITKASDMVQEQWFVDAINTPEPVDLFLVLGHNPARMSGTTFPVIREAIRKVHPTTPIQFFGGHTHTRDFKAYDNSSTALEPGRYCETLGWLAMSGIKAGKGNHTPSGVPNPTRPAINGTVGAEMKYDRRYIDWNRHSFDYHSDNVKTFDTPRGNATSQKIWEERHNLNLTNLYGCAPQTYCLSCAPQNSSLSIYPLVQKALAATVINPDRATIPRMIYVNTGGFRFDLVKGPFTYDDSFIVAPFRNLFRYIPNVPYEYVKDLINTLNAGPHQKRDTERFHETFLPRTVDSCPLDGMDFNRQFTKRRVFTRRQVAATPGYTTNDDFGTDGDDTPHSAIPYYDTTNDVVSQANFPADGSNPKVVDVVFYDFIQSYVISGLAKAGGKYTLADVAPYMPESFTSNDFLPAYAKLAWGKDC